MQTGLFNRRVWIFYDAAENAPLNTSHSGILYSYPAVDLSQLSNRTTDNILYAYAFDSLYTYIHAIADVIATGNNPYQVDILRDALVRVDFKVCVCTSVPCGRAFRKNPDVCFPLGNGNHGQRPVGE